ncbi:GNAT family N-acetyltransferase [Natronobiforma cellulositropha]|uniref:GNAT family N-acetyltransferase n=1 Tax=Natronobiforma cellulositropha TaxID=1679076 RepID=UPI0021D603F4|nr:GNAT family N-acetyltransferase [Natronobiforma cellulositropha]
MTLTESNPSSGVRTRRERAVGRPSAGGRTVDAAGSGLCIRPYEAADHAGLSEMYEAFEATDCAQGIPPLTPVRLRNWLETLLEDGYHAVAELDGRVVGHCLYTPLERAAPELAVFVHPSVQGRGIGTKLCRHVVGVAAANGREALVLDVERRNRAALALYRGLGFEPVGRGGRDQQMRLTLADGPTAGTNAHPADP